MARTAVVKYHVHKDELQAFELDAGGMVGNLISPQLASTQVRLTDLRCAINPVRFDQDAVEFVSNPSAVEEFSGDGWQ